MSAVEDQDARWHSFAAKLIPELKKSLRSIGGERPVMVHNRFLVMPFVPTDEWVAMLNTQHRLNRERYEDACLHGEFELALFSCIARPYRPQVFDELCHRMSDAEYWRLAGAVYVDQDDRSPHEETWLARFRENRTHRELLMEAQEWQDLAALPDKVVIYRAGERWGLSWTTYLEKAEWYANRFGLELPVWRSSVRKQNIFAYFTRRGESEVVLLERSHLEEVPREL